MPRIPDEDVRASALAELTEIADDEAEAAELDALFPQVITRAERLYPRLNRLIQRVEIAPYRGNGTRSEFSAAVDHRLAAANAVAPSGASRELGAGLDALQQMLRYLMAVTTGVPEQIA